MVTWEGLGKSDALSNRNLGEKKQIPGFLVIIAMMKLCRVMKHGRKKWSINIREHRGTWCHSGNRDILFPCLGTRVKVTACSAILRGERQPSPS